MMSLPLKWRPIAFLCAAAAVPALASALLHPTTWIQEVRGNEVNLATARQWEPLWVDARSREHFEKEHIPSALLLNLEEWDTLLDPFLDRWNPDQRIVIYCSSASCDASQEVADKLAREAQIKNVFVLKGGWVAWKSSRPK